MAPAKYFVSVEKARRKELKACRDQFIFGEGYMTLSLFRVVISQSAIRMGPGLLHGLI